MDKQTAINRLNLLVLHCHICGKELQTYRAVPSKIWDTPGTAPEVQTTIENKARKDSATMNESKNEPSINSPEEEITTSSNQEHPQKLIETPTSKDIDCFCFNCIAEKKVPLSKLHNETFYDLALRFIDFIPLPEYELTERCLELNELIQTRSSEILHKIEEQLENMKFFLLKLGSETRKVCQNYIKTVKEYENMNWMEIVKNMVSNNKHKALNQVDCLESFKKRMAELAKIRAKVDEVSINIPEFADVFVIENRKKIKICDLPISSMINLRGRTYYGAADGRIIYESFEYLPVTQPSHNSPTQLQLPTHCLKSSKCHESLIRSFAHNSQYTLFSGSDDFTIKAWSTFGGQLTLLHTFGILEEHKSYHRNICVVGDGKRLVSTRGQYDGYRIRVWGNIDEQQNSQEQNEKNSEKENKEEANEYVGIGCLEAHTSFIRAMIVVDRNKDIIMTGSDDQRVCLWDGRNMRLIRVLKRERKVNNIIANQDGNLLAILEEDNRIYILDMASMQCISMWQFPRKVLSSIGWSNTKKEMNHVLNSFSNFYYPNSDHILISMPSSLSIWNWCGDKIWSFDIETSYTPTSMMQIGQTIVVSDGTGRIDEFIVKDLN